MRTMRRIVLEEAIIGAVFLIGLWYIYYLVAVWGLLDYMEDSLFRDYVTGPGIHVEMLLVGLGLGILLAFVNHLAEAPEFRKRPFGQIILMKACLYLAGLGLMATLVNLVFILFLFSLSEIQSLWETLSLRFLFSLGMMMALSLLALSFLLEVRRKVGPGNLSALLTGRYHRPREENRAFLFLDLKGSTSIAERLGHSRYSQFIRHCFHDLTDSVLLFRAQIYQFVGDEVVLTWPAGTVNAGKHSLDTFFAFRRRLEEREDWYREAFGVVPEFRGGVEEGLVTVTEVGDIKREIAFHGDALNTAARLLDLCREYQQPLLVSGKIQKAIAGESGLSTELYGEITLRGKAEPTSVYGVDRAATG